MAVKSIKFVEEVDNAPSERTGWDRDYGQGSTYQNFHIFELTNDDGTKQFLKVAVTHDSYGTANGIGPNSLSLVRTVTKTVTTWE